MYCIAGYAWRTFSVTARIRIWRVFVSISHTLLQLCCCCCCLKLLAPAAGRWYGGNVLMPDGTSYVTGGDLGPGSPRALGEKCLILINKPIQKDRKKTLLVVIWGVNLHAHLVRKIKTFPLNTILNMIEKYITGGHPVPGSGA
jgi:hypothetical protein